MISLVLITIINDFIVKNTPVTFIDFFIKLYEQCNDNEIDDALKFYQILQNNKDLVLVQFFLKFNEINDNYKALLDKTIIAEAIRKLCGNDKLTIEQLKTLITLTKSNITSLKRNFEESSSSDDEDPLYIAVNNNNKEEKIKKNVEFSLFKKQDGKNLRWVSDNGNSGKYYIDLKICTDSKILKKVEKDERWKHCDIIIKGNIGSYLNKNDEGNKLIKSLLKHCHDTATGLPDVEFKETKIYNFNNNNSNKKKK